MYDRPASVRMASTGALIVLLLLGAYLLPFLAVLVDELLLGTYFFSELGGEWAGELFETIYAPLIWLVRQFLS